MQQQQQQLFASAAARTGCHNSHKDCKDNGNQYTGIAMVVLVVGCCATLDNRCHQHCCCCFCIRQTTCQVLQQWMPAATGGDM